MLSFGVYLSLTFVWLSPRAVLVDCWWIRVWCRVVFLASWIPITTCFIAFIDPAIDRRIIYNDFRSNPYLHFDAGLIPRALGVQLGEFYYLV